MIVLDTNVLSEAMKTNPSEQVLEWLASQSSNDLFTTAVTKAELLYGVELLPHGRRRAALQKEVDEMLSDDLDNRILPFDSDAAEHFAQIYAARRALGRPISDADAQIAAITRSQAASLATRNVHDFAHCGIKVVNPWA